MHFQYKTVQHIENYTFGGSVQLYQLKHRNNAVLIGDLQSDHGSGMQKPYQQFFPSSIIAYQTDEEY